MLAEICIADPPRKRRPQDIRVIQAARGKPGKLSDWFDQVWVINLKRRQDRLEQFQRELKKANWPFRKPTVFTAIEGDKVGVPKFWQTGAGSYGFMRSQLVLLERALQDDVESILILKDDAIFSESFSCGVADFLAKVPDDWQCLMLGGQHVNSTPFPVVPGVVRAGAGGGIQRTHCYALRGHQIMCELYQVWANAAVHCDWVMGPCTAKFNTYAPDPFLVGQSEGSSDISGGINPPKFWRSPSGNEPVIVLQAPRPVMEGLRNQGWHAGFNRDPNTGIDAGLQELFVDAAGDAARLKVLLQHWINSIQWEVVSMTDPAICTIWHPEIKADMVRPLVRGRVLEISAKTVEEALAQLPQDIHLDKSLPLPGSTHVIQVALLRSSRAVMEVLQEDGWHCGHWRDDVTGLDNGIRRLFASTPDPKARSAGLLDIVHTLDQEVRHKGRGIVTLWHDDITPDMLKSDKVQVFEIKAGNANEAKAQLQEMTRSRA